MAPRSNRGLSIESSKVKISRKYLGEIHDPHFIPSSPLIERPVLSAQDEAELTRVCTLALANVPHSDDMADDPFRYLGKHILVKTQTRTKPVPVKQPTAREKAREQLTNITTRESANDDTATPSENSRRATIQTTGSTPMTSPGLTPGETGKTFEDAVRRVTTSSSNLKTENKPAKGNAVYAFLKDPLAKNRPQGPIATKSLTHLPVTKTKSRQPPTEISIAGKNEPFGTPDFNKSLPALPRSSSIPSVTALPNSEKVGIFSRFFKTARQPRTQPTVILQVNTTAPEVNRLVEEDKTNVDPQMKRKRFNITAIFNKNNTAYPKRATVG